MRCLLFLVVLGTLIPLSCTKGSAGWDTVTNKQVVYNPYDGIDFQSASRVKAISHEHISRKSQLKIAYDRGIRYFACVNYLPACPSYPLSNWSYEYEDYVSPSDLTLTSLTYSGSIPSFVDKNGVEVNTDDLVQLPNAEHLFYSNTSGSHFNVLGSLFCESAHGGRNKGEWSDEALGMKKKDWYSHHPKWDIKDINPQYLNPSNQLFPGKVFGTINHTSNEKAVRSLLNECPDVFKAIEIVNQGSTESDCKKFRKLWDKLLSEGKRIWGTSAIDWQSLGPDGNPRLGACNVLLINDYDSHTLLEKSELGLDAYISGCFIPAGLADNEVVDFVVTSTSVKLQVTGHPSQMIVVTNRGKTEYSGTNEVEYTYGRKDTYVRFEVWYRDEEGTLKDYLFTNPIFIENADE